MRPAKNGRKRAHGRRAVATGRAGPAAGEPMSCHRSPQQFSLAANQSQSNMDRNGLRLYIITFEAPFVMYEVCNKYNNQSNLFTSYLACHSK